MKVIRITLQMFVLVLAAHTCKISAMDSACNAHVSSYYSSSYSTAESSTPRTFRPPLGLPEGPLDEHRAQPATVEIYDEMHWSQVARVESSSETKIYDKKQCPLCKQIPHSSKKIMASCCLQSFCTRCLKQHYALALGRMTRKELKKYPGNYPKCPSCAAVISLKEAQERLEKLNRNNTIISSKGCCC